MPVRRINHHGKTITVKPLLRTLSETQRQSNGSSVVNFFTNNKVEDDPKRSVTPVHSTPLMKDILRAKNLSISDLIARNEEVIFS